MSSATPAPKKRRRRENGEGTIYRRADRPELPFGALDRDVAEGEPRKRDVVIGRTRAEVREKLAELQKTRELLRQVAEERERLAVLEQLDELRERVRKDQPVVDDPQTVGEFLEAWLADVVKASRSPNTWRVYEAKVRLYPMPELGDRRLAMLRPGHVQAAVRAWQEQGKPPKAIRYAIDVLKTALAHARRLELVERNVAEPVDLPQVETREIEPLDRAGVDRFLEAAAGHRLEALFRVVFALGIREGEALGLRRQDVSLEERLVRIRVQLQWNPITKRWELVRLKTPKARRDLKLPEVAVAALRRQSARQAEDRLRAGDAWETWDGNGLIAVDEGDGLVFANELGGPIKPRDVRYELKKLRDAAQLPGLRFHDSRHTNATFMLALGVPERIAMDVLGHTNPNMTRRYQHVPAELRQQAADLIDRALGPADVAVPYLVAAPSDRDSRKG